MKINNLVMLDKLNNILNLFYPVGSYYETSDSTFNPNETWGGTWVEDSSGRVLIAKGDLEVFDKITEEWTTLAHYNNGEIPGDIYTEIEIPVISHSHTYNKTGNSTDGHTLVVSEMPTHAHNTPTINANENGYLPENGNAAPFVLNYSAAGGIAFSSQTKGWSNNIAMANSGGNNAHSHNINFVSAQTGNTGETNNKIDINVIQPSLVVTRWHRIA